MGEESRRERRSGNTPASENCYGGVDDGADSCDGVYDGDGDDGGVHMILSEGDGDYVEACDGGGCGCNSV